MIYKTLNFFEYVSRITEPDFPLPKRATAKSAGYDFVCPEDVQIPAGGSALIATGVKAHMDELTYLALHIRSSIGIKRGLILANCTGIIDGDYYNNPDNEGEIYAKLINLSDKPQEIAKGEKFMQGIFCPYDLTDADWDIYEYGDESCSYFKERTGGIGSTDA